MQRAFAIFDGQEVACHRYAGHDPEIQKRVGVENCDFSSHLGAKKISGEQTHAPEFWAEPGFFERLWAKIWRRS
jgi:hypothetical protein